jgi:hypothetical protein
MGEKITEADTLMKKANKYWQPSLMDFRLKPDWEAAAPLFEKAALLYKVCVERNCAAACGLTSPAWPTAVLLLTCTAVVHAASGAARESQGSIRARSTITGENRFGLACSKAPGDLWRHQQGSWAA